MSVGMSDCVKRLLRKRRMYMPIIWRNGFAAGGPSSELSVETANCKDTCTWISVVYQ